MRKVQDLEKHAMKVGLSSLESQTFIPALSEFQRSSASGTVSSWIMRLLTKHLLSNFLIEIVFHFH